MSLFGTLAISSTGLQAQSNKLGIISDNIANQNTIGYKGTVANFKSLVGSDSVRHFTPGGVLGGTQHLNTAQGVFSAASSVSDLAISGPGFFAVSQDPASTLDIVYTRAGSFAPDGNGDFFNAAGYYLQAWRLDDNGVLNPALSGAEVDSSVAIAALETVNVQGISSEAVATTLVSIKANLNSTQAVYVGPPAYDPLNNLANMVGGVVQPHFSRDIEVFSANPGDPTDPGTTHTLTVGFLRLSIDATPPTPTSTWAVEIYSKPLTDVTSPASGRIGFGTVTFNGDGTLNAVSASLKTTFPVTWQNGNPSAIAFGWGTEGPVAGPGVPNPGLMDGLGQLATNYGVDRVAQNGFLSGTLESISINEQGIVTGHFTNGNVLDLYRIPLAVFNGPDQLESVTGNAFRESIHSGTATFSAAGGAVGSVESGFLESSNVSIAEQLTDMIVAQNAYKYNASLLTTANDMLQTLERMAV